MSCGPGESVKHKNYPSIGACGIDCYLCPMHHVRKDDGCPGCTAPVASGTGGRWCVIARCAVRDRQYETCGECPEFPCVRLEGLDESDSFVTHRNTMENLRCIRENGIAGFVVRQERRVAVLRSMLTEFDDGRSKSHFCLACALLPTDKLETALSEALVEVDEAGLGEDRKSRARVMRERLRLLAEGMGVELRLRRR